MLPTQHQTEQQLKWSQRGTAPRMSYFMTCQTAPIVSSESIALLIIDVMCCSIISFFASIALFTCCICVVCLDAWSVKRSKRRRLASGSQPASSSPFSSGSSALQTLRDCALVSPPSLPTPFICSPTPPCCNLLNFSPLLPPHHHLVTPPPLALPHNTNLQSYSNTPAPPPPSPPPPTLYSTFNSIQGCALHTAHVQLHAQTSSTDCQWC